MALQTTSNHPLCSLSLSSERMNEFVSDEGEVELHCNGMAEERKEMVKVMNEIMEGWQEMDGKDKVVCVVDKACENGRIRREMERLYRKRLD